MIPLGMVLAEQSEASSRRQASLILLKFLINEARG
jgi:hypothetical protein